jgi:diguanylate cyclase (GGDEF)-like protein/PAS domain S-box-containing protein
MTLYKKTLTIVGLTFVGLIVALYAVSRVIVLGSFAQQEEQDTRQNVERVQSALADNLSALSGTTQDWAWWDDTYAYIQDTNEGYSRSNLSADAPFVSNRLNLMVFIHSSGKVVFARAYDYRNRQQLPIPDDLQRHITSGSLLLRHEGAGEGMKGLLSLREGAMLVAAEPILTSERERPARGTLIFGRYLDTEEIARLSKTTLFSLTAHQVNGPQMPSDFLQALGSLSKESPTLVQPLNSDSIAGYALFDDIYGKPALVLRAEMPRGVYARGEATAQYFMLILMAVGLVFAIVTLSLVGRTVLARVARLSADVRSIGAQGDLSARIATEGSDEVASLGGSINAMLEALQHSHHEQRESEERYRAVVQQTSEGMFLVDVGTKRFLEANMAFEDLLGYTSKELLGLTLYDVVANSPESVDRNIRRVLEDGQLLLGERQYRRKDGSLLDVEVSASLISYGGREVLCIVVRDITERKRADEALRELAIRDGLTGLYNRREMHRLIREEADRCHHHGRPAALVMLDIDHFKSVNDTYGHQVGDEVLRRMAQVLRDNVRSVDRVARYGGEELAIILPETTSTEAFEMAERLRRVVSGHVFTIPWSGDQVKHIPLTVSLGVAGIPDDADTEESIIVQADRALYEAKRLGRDRTVEAKNIMPQPMAVSPSRKGTTPIQTRPLPNFEF